MNDHYKFENIPLPYAYDAMEPYIDAKTMELHHDKHLQTYIDNLNKALADYPRLQRVPLEELIVNADKLPREIRMQVRHNAGGVYNHRFYFLGLKNTYSYHMASGALADAIKTEFGSLEKFKSDFKAAALSVFGSGYAWLTMNRKGMLIIITTANQDTPITDNLCPILTTDVWEHAYYLKYQNRRADYIDSWFHVIDWDRAEKNYLDCKCLVPYKHP